MIENINDILHLISRIRLFKGKSVLNNIFSIGYEIFEYVRENGLDFEKSHTALWEESLLKEIGIDNFVVFISIYRYCGKFKIDIIISDKNYPAWLGFNLDRLTIESIDNENLIVTSLRYNDYKEVFPISRFSDFLESKIKLVLFECFEKANNDLKNISLVVSTEKPLFYFLAEVNNEKMLNFYE